MISNAKTANDNLTRNLPLCDGAISYSNSHSRRVPVYSANSVTWVLLAWRRTEPARNQLPCASCQMRKIAGCACAGNARNVFPVIVDKRSQHASRHVRDAPWCNISLVSFEVGGGENVLGIPDACATRNFTYLARGAWYWPRYSTIFQF